MERGLLMLLRDVCKDKQYL